MFFFDGNSTKKQRSQGLPAKRLPSFRLNPLRVPPFVLVSLSSYVAEPNSLSNTM
jgi:hypothetical protein